MRLVCPKCEAKYEVPDDAIPEGGRDVQCANCNHAWFQMRPVAAEPTPVLTPVADAPPVATAAPSAQRPEPEIEPEVEPEITPEDLPEDLPEEVPEELPGALPVEIPVDLPEDAPEELPEDEPEIAPEPGIEAASETEPEVDPEPEIEAAPAYKVDDSVLAILREEAEREVKARRAETNISEPPPALGAALAAAAAAAPAGAPVAEEARPAARRDLLPDVEEINSSLRPSEHEQDHTPADLPPPETGGGFRSGFLMVMAVAMIGAAVYLAAPALSRLVPALAEPLDSYVALINGLRLQLDGVMRQATVALNGG